MRQMQVVVVGGTQSEQEILLGRMRQSIRRNPGRLVGTRVETFQTSTTTSGNTTLRPATTVKL